MVNMNCLYLECKNFRDFAEKDRISALLFCEVLNLNFDYFYDFDKQTGYVDGKHELGMRKLR